MPRFASVLTTLALTAAFGATALAQPAPPVVVRGSVVSLDGNVLTVKGATSTSKITLADNVRVAWVIKTDFSKIAPGTFIGTAAVPQADGTYRALEIQLFDQANHPGEADRAWDVAPQSTMTNATIASITSTTVDKVDGRLLILKLKDGEKKVFVPANAPIVTSVPADKTAFTPGANVWLFAVKKDDGSLSAASVQVGKDGLVIPY